MHDRKFWFVDDEQHVRWAVRLSRPFATPEHPSSRDARIVFTSARYQISTAYALEKEQHELSKYELLELLAQAKREWIESTDASAAA